MKILDFFQLNDVDIILFIKCISLFQLLFYIFILSDILNIHIPIIRQLFIILYIMYIPGIIVLRILKIHKQGIIETLLYSIGLSLSIIMFFGFLLNMLSLLIGFLTPLTLVSLSIVISTVIWILLIIGYYRDKNFSDVSYIEFNKLLSPPALFLLFIPFISIFGAYCSNYFQANILLMIQITIISIIALLISYNKFIPTELYSLSIYVISLSLLLHVSLISNYIIGSDIHYEYFLSNKIFSNSVWYPTIPQNINNTMLSISLLPVILSKISGISLTWIFKLIYPLIFSFVPLGLYIIVGKSIDKKVAFLSSFFFVALFVFYNEMLGLARQQIAEFYFILLILLMIKNNITSINKSYLLIIFGFSLAVSHYGLSYVYMICIILIWIMMYLGNTSVIRRLSNYLNLRESKNEIIKNKSIKSTFIILYIVFSLMWYIYVYGSSGFDSIVRIASHISNSIFNEFLKPHSTQALGIILTQTSSNIHEITKYLHLSTQFFIGIGLLSVLFKRKTESNFNSEYKMFSLAMFFLVVSGILIPRFSDPLNTSRLYQISLLILAPYCIIGFICMFRFLISILKNLSFNTIFSRSVKIFSIFIVFYLLFNSGWIYEITQDNPSSIALSKESITTNGNYIDKMIFHSIYITDIEYKGSKWISYYGRDGIIYSDSTTENYLISYGEMELKNHKIITNKTELLEKGTFLFLGFGNIRYEKCSSIIFNQGRSRTMFNLSTIKNILDYNNKIYSNGGSEVYYGI